MSRYEEAKLNYEKMGVDVEGALTLCAATPISIHCWQGDDVRGFDQKDGRAGDGIQTTGDYPGRAGSFEELKADFLKAASLIPGKKRINLHASYAVFPEGEWADRDKTAYRYFIPWVEFAREHGFGIDFNPTCFSHPMVKNGLTLSSPDEAVRRFWIDHCIACRQVAQRMGEALGDKVLNNIWVPDGMKDVPADRMGPRLRLKAALDEIFAENCPNVIDSVESKVFGIHVTRPVRWDSDHVVLFDDELREMMTEIVRCGGLQKVLIGLDFFDASINRVAAWVVGTRNAQKALLWALLQPHEALKALQDSADFTEKMVRMEEAKTLPFGDIWREYCRREGVSADESWFEDVKAYEREVLSRRGT